MALANLPVLAWPNQAVDQNHLYAKLEQYLNAKRKIIKRDKTKDKIIKKRELKNCELPFNSPDGLCSGLVAYWLYLKRDGAEGKFIYLLDYIVKWDPQQMQGATDPVLEEFLNNIEFLHFDYILRRDQDVLQEHIAGALNFLLAPHQDQVQQEYAMSFVFNRGALQTSIEELVKNNKMVYLNSIDHAIGLMRSGDVYYLYDPEYKFGMQSFNSSAALVEAIFAAFAPDSEDKEYITIYMSILDLGIDPEVEYPAAHEYCLNLVQRHNYIHDLIKKPRLAHLLVKHKQIDTLIALIKSGMRLDNKSTLTTTLAGMAIDTNDYILLYILLSNGADITSLHHYTSLWDQAIFKKNPQALALLLAFGYQPPKDMILLGLKFNEDEIRNIFTTAIKLHAELLQVPAVLDLNRHTAHDIVMFLRHMKLMRQLGSQAPISLRFNGHTYSNIAALKQLARFYKTTRNTDMFDAAQKTEIYGLLKFFKVDGFEFHGSKQLIAILGDIQKQIIGKKPDQYSIEELTTIGVILDQLDEILHRPTNYNPRKHYLRHKAALLQITIVKHFKQYGISAIKDYINQMHTNSLERNYMFFAPDTQHRTTVNTTQVFGILQQGLGMPDDTVARALQTLHQD